RAYPHVRKMKSRTLPVRTNAARLSRLAMMSLALFACAKDAAEEEPPPTAVTVRTAVVVATTFTEKVGALGTIAARPGRSASLSAPAQTRVTQVSVVVGDRVSQGQTLIVLDQTLFREAARSASAKLTAAQRAYERARTLAEAGILPRKDVEQASADLAAARSELVAARKTEQLAVLRSPISGVVTRLSATLGASVDVNQPLVDVADPNALDAILGMTPTDAGKVHVGNKVELRAGQSASGELLGVGTIREISAVIDSLTRNVSVRAVAPGTTRPLKIDETVYGEVAVATKSGVITVPVEALVPEGDGFVVFVVDAKNVVHAREVKVGARDSKTAEILEGLTAGLRIVTYGAYGLADNATIVVSK
ncbi:MAG: efflux RND transporter periplasmic adaptor subunit, partial [Gemmatimonadales bacterium]